jgi:hypothetical protein
MAPPDASVPSVTFPVSVLWLTVNAPLLVKMAPPDAPLVDEVKFWAKVL